MGVLPSLFAFEIVDILEDPVAATEDRIFATPTIARISPPPTRKIVGDISDPEKIAALLGLV
jgi:circadian clock protein KaiB